MQLHYLQRLLLHGNAPSHSQGKCTFLASELLLCDLSQVLFSHPPAIRTLSGYQHHQGTTRVLGGHYEAADGGGQAQGCLTCRGPSEDWILCSGISEAGM